MSPEQSSTKRAQSPRTRRALKRRQQYVSIVGGRVTEKTGHSVPCVRQKSPQRKKACNARLKRAVFEAYGGCKCACRGEATFEFQSIDHSDNSGAEHRRESYGMVTVTRGVKERERTSGSNVIAIHLDFVCSAGTALLSWAIVHTILPLTRIALRAQTIVDDFCRSRTHRAKTHAPTQIR